MVPPDPNYVPAPAISAVVPAAAPFPTLVPDTPTIPTVSPQTLLAAANLPGAPAEVVQAAAQYQQQNPMAAFFYNVPMLGWVAGAAVLLLLLTARRR